MFSLPQAETDVNGMTHVEGQTEEHPIVLADTTELEFDNLLEYLYFGYAFMLLDHDNRL